jgi:excisionase family DNA binding protein
MPQNISSERVLLSTSEAVQLSGLSREHIQRLLRAGRIEGRKPGHDWLVYEDSLKSFLAQPRKPGPKRASKPLSDQGSNTTPIVSDNGDEQNGKA